jgi:hypothetical protein
VPYTIPDEPHPTRLQSFVVNPLYPMFATMLAGAWLGWPWFALNAAALGSPTRRREWVVLVACASTTVGLVTLLLSLDEAGAFSELSAALAVIAIDGVKLAFALFLYTVQGRAFVLHEHFGGRVRSGLPVFLLGVLVVRSLVLSGGTAWVLVMR